MAENGKIPDSQLAPVPGHPNARLTPAAAEAFGRVRTGVQAAYGWTPAITSDVDAYRPYDVQVRTFLQRYTPQATGSGPKNDVRFWNGVRYVRTTGYAAAVPGTSNHGWGIAVDIADIGSFSGALYSQFKAVAEPIGWSNSEGRSVDEPWHWTFGKPSTNPTNPSEEDDMTPDQAGQLQDIFNRVRSLGGANPQQPLLYGDNFQVIASRLEKVPELYDRVRGTDPAGDMLQLLRQRVINLEAKIDQLLER